MTSIKEIAVETNEAAQLLASFRIFTCSREKAKQPEGTDLFDQQIERLRRLATSLDALAAQSQEPRLVPDCAKCEGRGYIDEGHLRDDGRMDSAPESCPNCYGTGKSHTCGERASCIPCEREDADKELEAKLRVRLLGAAARLRMRAACELNQPRGHTMDAREWASTCLECAAEDIEAEAGGRAPQPAPPQPAVSEEFEKALDELVVANFHAADYTERHNARAEVLRLYALAAGAAVKVPDGWAAELADIAATPECRAELDRLRADAAPPQPAVSEESADRLAYEGAREDLLDWKRRALKAEAALAGAAVKVPDGWKLVPVEPTPEMVHAGCGADNVGMQGHGYMLNSTLKRNVYTAMLNAAPEAGS